MQKRSLDFSDIDDSQIPETEGDSMDDYSKFSMEEIKEEIEALPEGYRVVLNLHLFEGMDHDEIAQILEIKAVSSRSQYMRARKKLGENLMNKYHARQA